jgi:hypothetical protein
VVSMTEDTLASLPSRKDSPIVHEARLGLEEAYRPVVRRGCG